MSSTAVRKNKIVLSDYNYQRDIENRLLLSDLSTFEVDVLHEILNNSITFSVASLAKSLGVTVDKLTPILKKFSSTKLLTIQGDRATVDKEMRKYYEFQIEKFDDQFQVNIEFILASLSKVPIHVLPSWYAIPRTSDNIYASLIEKHLQTPKIYERYLSELNFEIPTLTEIMKDVFSAKDFKVQSNVLREKYQLSREQFEEYMLYLEFNFVCFLSYNRIDNMWKEVVTPFYEWREYLQFHCDSVPQTVSQVDEIERVRKEDFAFVQDLSLLLKSAQQKPIALVKIDEGYTLSPKAIAESFPAYAKEKKAEIQKYIETLVHKCLQMEIAEIRDEHLYALESSKTWQNKAPQDLAIALYRHPHNQLRATNQNPSLYSERNIREIERSLKRVIKSEWVYFEDFKKGLCCPIGNAEPVSLKNKGKRWKYTLPVYSDEELTLIESIIFERFFEVGVVAVGTHQGKPCFKVTTFGRIALGD